MRYRCTLRWLGLQGQHVLPSLFRFRRTHQSCPIPPHPPAHATRWRRSPRRVHVVPDATNRTLVITTDSTSTPHDSGGHIVQPVETPLNKIVNLSEEIFLLNIGRFLFELGIAVLSPLLSFFEIRSISPQINKSTENFIFYVSILYNTKITLVHIMYFL